MSQATFPFRYWELPELTQVNRLPMKATFHLYESEASALARIPAHSHWYSSLNGDWFFRLYPSPEAIPDEDLSLKVQLEDLD